MATQSQDSLANLERLRQSLETSIDKLRTSLRYWETWEYEHAGFKEELEQVGDELSTEEMLVIGTDLELEIVDAKDIKDLIGYGKKPQRSRAHVISNINGRIDTGQKNAATMQKQLALAEANLEKVLAASEPALEKEEEEPLMDIFEELDEEGNVVSSSVVNAEKDHKALTSMLKGQDVFPNEIKEFARQSQKEVPETSTPPATPHAKVASPSLHDTGRTSSTGKKVSFAQEPKIHEIPAVPTTRSFSTLPRLPPRNMHPSQRMLIIDHNDQVVDSKPLELIHPPIEDEKIDYLREARENAKEIAPIVASFDIEPDSDSDMDDDDSDFSDDEYGMNDTSLALTDEYRQEMEALMRKHAVQMENAGPNFDGEVMEKLATAHRDPKLIPTSALSAAESEGLQSKSTNGIGLRFAEGLDVSPAPVLPKPAPTMAPESDVMNVEENPVSEAVIERTTTQNTSSARSGSDRKPSRFKTNMNATANGAGDTHKPDSTAAPFVATSPPAVITADDSTLAERPKKISRFKAAKLGG